MLGPLVICQSKQMVSWFHYYKCAKDKTPDAKPDAIISFLVFYLLEVYGHFKFGCSDIMRMA